MCALSLSRALETKEAMFALTTVAGSIKPGIAAMTNTTTNNMIAHRCLVSGITLIYPHGVRGYTYAILAFLSSLIAVNSTSTDIMADMSQQRKVFTTPPTWTTVTPLSTSNNDHTPNHDPPHTRPRVRHIRVRSGGFVAAPERCA